MKNIFIVVLIFLSLNSFSQEKTLQNIRTGIIFDGESEFNKQILDFIKTDVKNLMENDYSFEFKDEKILNSEWNLNEVENNFNKLSKDETIDLILPIGFISSSKIPQNTNKIIINPLTYLDLNFDEDIKLFKKIYNFKKITIVKNKLFTNTLFDEIEKKLLKSLKDENIEYKFLEISSVSEVISNISINDEAVLLLSTINFTQEDVKQLSNDLIAKKIPSFSVLGIKDVENGILASIDITDFLKYVSRKITISIQRKLLKQNFESENKSILFSKNLVINIETAKKINLNLNNEILIESDLLNSDYEENSELLTMEKAIEQSVEKNLDIIVQYELYKSENETINEANSLFYPKVELSATGAIIDSDRAGASLGMYPERSLSTGLTITQIIYAEKVWANIDIKKNLHKISEFKIEQLKQDIAVETAVMYMNIVRLQLLEKVQRQNLKITKHHLNLAKIRKDLGVAGPGEIYRWEGQYITNKKAIIEAIAKKKMAMMALNRLLHKPLENLFSVSDVSANDKIFLTSYTNIENYYNNKENLKILKDFLTKEGLNNSYELKQIETAVETQKRYLTSVKKSYYYPTVALQGNVSYRLWEGGEGANYEIKLPPGMSDMFGGLFPKTDDLEWSVGLKISLPLFEGFATQAEESKNNKMLSKYLLEKQAIMEKLEQRVRTMVEQSSITYPSIKLTKEAKEVAKKSLNLVEDAYSKGFASTIDLIDIQNTNLLAEEACANSIYEYLTDVLNIQRSIGKVVFKLNENELKVWNENLLNSNK